jgi:acyl-ACP thioesterase
LPAPSASALRSEWPLRATDVDLHGHVNNAVYWQALEGALGPDAATRLVAELDFRDPIDLADPLELAVERAAEVLSLGFVVGVSARAVARLSLSGEV